MAEDSPHDNYTVCMQRLATFEGSLGGVLSCPCQRVFVTPPKPRRATPREQSACRREQMDHRGGPMRRGGLVSISVPALLTAATNIATDHVSDGTCCLV